MISTKHISRKFLALVGLVLAVGLVASYFSLWHVKSPFAATSGNFDKQKYSLSDASSIWIIVNKSHPIVPSSYMPTDLEIPAVPLRVPGNDTMQLRAVAVSALQQMFKSAQNSGLNLMLSSGFRSYSYQKGLYDEYVQAQGQKAADQSSARPGYSEHQTGLAVDIEPAGRNCEVELCFASTPEAKWLAANAFRFGFILRYPSDKVPVTGYEYEPWHYRYVGVNLATEMHSQHVETLEEFFNVTGGLSY